MITEPTTKPNPTRQIAIPETSLPDVIELTISEVDRQTAGEYSENQNCLICTALRNRGINVISVGPELASLNDWHDYHIESGGRVSDLNVDVNAKSTPFYHREIVGKTIKLRKIWCGKITQ